MRSVRSFSRLRLAFPLFVLFLLACALGGGASRADVASLLAVRLAGIAVLAHACLFPPRDIAAVRVPLLLLGALALVMLMQQVPLPPALWMRLPGHAPYAQAAIAAGIVQPWRPLALTPDLAWNSLFALVPPLAALVGFATLDAAERARLLPLLIGIALASALAGVLQLAQGPSSALYLYRVTNGESPVGLFANRNHQALLLALALPALGTFALADGRHAAGRVWVALVLAVALLPVILVTGSRAGLLLAAAGILLAAVLAAAPAAADGRAPRRRTGLPLLLAAGAAGAAMVGITIALSRATALQRLFRFAPGEETRIGLIGPLVRIARDFLPLGGGFGAFETLYRQREPFALLDRSYLNHAHNDVVELAIEGGLPALLILFAFLCWWGRSSLRLWGRRAAISRRDRLARLGAAMVPMMLIASLPDYPLRTPLLAVVLAIACAWIGDAAAPRRAAVPSPDLATR